MLLDSDGGGIDDGVELSLGLDPTFYDDDIHGCTYPDASNYNALAFVEDGSCVFDLSCPDLDGNGIVDTTDLLEILVFFGLPCPE